MRRSRLRSTIELLGVVGVIGSLVFVGIEIRQNSAATRAAATQALGQSWIDWNVATASREIQEAVVLLGSMPDPSAAPLVEQLMVGSYARSILSNWSISHYQYRMGVLDRPLWDGVLRDMSSAADTSHLFGRVMAWAWPQNRYLYNTDFTALLDSVMPAEEQR